MLDLADKSYFINEDKWRYKVQYVHPGDSLNYTPDGTTYVMAQDCDFHSPRTNLSLVSGAIQTTKPFELFCGATGSAVVIDYYGLNQHEDRIYIPNNHSQGSLSYMDGGTNTTAIEPSRVGEPVINYVHFPAQMFQTLHTHPSQRIGLIVRGNGSIVLKDDEIFKLKEGHAFFMERNELHNFVCDDEDVVLFVWAPDSGTGATDEYNALKVRTYVKGQT